MFTQYSSIEAHRVCVRDGIGGIEVWEDTHGDTLITQTTQ